jgi:hypothetical protein
MAITTVQQIADGILPSRPIGRFGLNSANAVPPRSSFIGGTASFPSGAPTMPTATNGVVLTNASAGALPFNNPPSGQNTYLAGMKWPHIADVARNIFLVDFLWSKQIDSRIITPQTIDSVQFPARDRNGSSNGDGVYIAINSYSGNGSIVSATISYTNSAGTSGRTGNMIWDNVTGQSGIVMPFSLDSGDLGVRSVQSVTLTADAGTGTQFALIAFRPIASISSFQTKTLELTDDAVSFGLPRIYDDSCLVFLYHGTFTVYGSVQFTQG